MKAIITVKRQMPLETIFTGGANIPTKHPRTEYREIVVEIAEIAKIRTDERDWLIVHGITDSYVIPAAEVHTVRIVRVENEGE